MKFPITRPNQPLRIGLVTSNFKVGGAERVIVNLANYYASSGHEVTIFAFRSSGPLRGLVNDGVEVVDLCSQSGGVFFKMSFVIRVAWSIWRSRLDCVFSAMRYSSIFLCLAAWMPGVDFAYREANPLQTIEQFTRLKRFLFKWVMRIAYLPANAIIANSTATRDDLLEKRITRANKISVVGNPAIPAIIPAHEGGAQHPWFSDADLEVVLNVGRLHPQKDQATLVRAFADVHRRRPQSRLLIVGEGPERSKLDDVISTYHLTSVVEILPFQQNPFPYYLSADVFVLSSKWEGFGNVLVEALACGIPIVSTDCPGGPRHILSDGDYGTLVAPGDTGGLSDAIIARLEGSAPSVDRRAASERAMEFSVPAVAEKYLAVCRGEM